MGSTTLILGLGNVLLTDEAVGAEVLKQLDLSSQRDPAWELMDGGTLSFTLAGPIGDAERLVVVDAAALDAPPGTIRIFEGEDMDAKLRSGAKSVHEVSLADLMDMARLSDQLPPRRALVAIQPDTIGWGEQLTPAVAESVPKAVAAILSIIERWDAGATTSQSPFTRPLSDSQQPS